MTTTSKNDNFILNNYQVLSRAKIAAHLHTSVSRLSSRMRHLGIRRYKPWTAEDEDYIRKHYKQQNCVEMAEHLGRTPNIVRARLCGMKIRRYKKEAVVLPPSLDLMHRETYKPTRWECFRAGAEDAFRLPSSTYQPSTTYHETHP